MRTNIVIDDELMDQAIRAGDFVTKKEAVEAALRLLVQVRAQGRIRKYRGKLNWQGSPTKKRQP